MLRLASTWIALKSLGQSLGRPALVSGQKRWQWTMEELSALVCFGSVRFVFKSPVPTSKMRRRSSTRNKGARSSRFCVLFFVLHYLETSKCATVSVSVRPLNVCLCVHVCSCVCSFVCVCVLYLFLPVVCFNYDCFLVDNVTFHGVELYVW